MLLAEGFEGAFIGVGRRHGQPDLAVYSVEKAVKEIIAKSDAKLTREEALDHFQYNLLGSWLGDSTPLWIDEMSVEKAQIEKEEERRMNENTD